MPDVVNALEFFYLKPMNLISPKNYAPQFRQHCLNTVGIPTRTAVKSLQKVCVAALFISVLSVPGIRSGFAAEEKKPVIGLVMKSLANEFFKDMQEGAIKHVAQRGDLTLLPVGMHSETDIDTQVNAVENFITKKVDAIVIAPADSRALVAPLARAIKAGIVVINIDVALDEEAKKQAGIDLAFVGPDNRAGAKMSGDVLAKALGEGGKVVIVEGNPGADNARQRKLGFDDAVKDGKLDLIDSRTAHWETEEANSVFSNMLTAHPDIQGVMAANDSMALGVVKAIDAAGKSGKIKVVGFDNIPAVQPLLKEGKLLATIDQFGSQMAANDSMALGVIKAIDAAGKSGKIKVVGFDNIPAVQPLLKDGKLLATIDQFGSQMAANGIDYAMKALAGEKLEGWIKTPIKLATAPGS